jgi:2-succinyl-6-hydroxy-2,4-cyclohexadiene-1-carboxylate synthase
LTDVDTIRYFGTDSNVVALHGFASTGQQFESFSRTLGRPISAPDLPGHGRSADADCQYHSVFSQLSEQLPSATPLLGYSQGARLAVAGVALRYIHPSALILISGTAGIEDDTEREERLVADNQLAEHILEIGLERFVDEWTSTGLTSLTHLPQDIRAEDHAIRLENTAEGLAAAIRGYGQGSLPPVWRKLDAISIPVLVVAGRRDRKYSDIGQAMTDAIGPNASLTIIESSNHNPMLDQPDTLAEEISEFLDRNA